MKVVLIMITGAYQLLQAIWFYTQHPECEYIALVKLADTNEQTKQLLVQYCSNCGIFKEILTTKNDVCELGAKKKIALGLKMFSYYITGRKKKLVHNLIQEQIGSLQYDIVLADSEISILGGAFINCAKEKRVYILQEGLYDIEDRRNLPILNLNKLIEYAISKMGYANPAMVYKLKGTKECYKLMSHPDLATYKNFKEIIKLFEMNEEQKYVFQKTILSTFGQLELKNIENADVIFISAPFHLFTKDESYYDSVHDWLKENFPYKKILIKRHPRDKHLYDWSDLDISIMNASLPAEIILPFCMEKKQIYMFISTCILDVLDKEIDYTVLKFEMIKSERYHTLFMQLQSKLSIINDHICKLQ